MHTSPTRGRLEDKSTVEMKASFIPASMSSSHCVCKTSKLPLETVKSNVGLSHVAPKLERSSLPNHSFSVNSPTINFHLHSAHELVGKRCSPCYCSLLPLLSLIICIDLGYRLPLLRSIALLPPCSSDVPSPHLSERVPASFPWKRLEDPRKEKASSDCFA